MTIRKAASLALATVLGACTPALAGDTTEVLDATRSTLAKWVETRQVISAEREDWTLGKQILEERVRLLEAEISEIEQRNADARAAIGEARLKRDELEAERAGLDGASQALQDIVASLEAKTKRLVGRLPAPLADRTAPLSRRLPDDPNDTKLSLGQRFQNVIGLLNEVNKFNGNVTLASEVRDLPDGGAAEVQALYLGLAQGWYVSPSGDSAGVGRPGTDGWEWSPADELAPRIAQAIAVLEGDVVPAYVPLPVVMP